ncbi:hypothetical protein CH254_02990 [Rhodococcus sp. 06-412-2C]|uniref:hypothetical protein n=1 Tax=unclassified Rhodococcus (in: high G+C Gram-positive bacteria) TaxID=192944 RepID=UPI000B9C429C|nr:MULTISPECIES: hypothetical protein [unclassified Rhodococcus (in: high G+C Gram-positive bacteria)]OZC90459.1 hypothetical protein CH279_29300 [Rhodococcus sp. 06-412-2B]OZC93158.1 hypothetical protein CH254_02990 [Rhodococcus sp. 06-412-2C]
MAFRIVPATAESWPQFRALRLEMLADSPKAFVETLDAASRQSDDDWVRRAAETPHEHEVVMAKPLGAE